MVFFTCFHCGEPIKKPNVAKHYRTKCRGKATYLTCVDCFKDFKGDEYDLHTKCITEEERYAETGFVPKPSSNKGERKQQGWFESVQAILVNNKKLRVDERELLMLLSNHENLPRKKAKFLNFISNAHRNYARKEDLVERVWNIIEAGKNTTADAEKNPKDHEENGNGNTQEINENGNIKEMNDDDDDKLKESVKQLIGQKISLHKFLKKLQTLAGNSEDELKSIHKKIRIMQSDHGVLLNIDKL